MKKRIIVICTGNSCRSILAEALLNHFWGESYDAVSAGSTPVGQVHPRALMTLEKNGIHLKNFRSKSWDEFENQEFDFVLTVCDSASKESCPYFKGEAKRIHWSIPDPAKAKGTEEEVDQEFQRVFEMLKSKIQKEFQ